MFTIGTNDLMYVAYELNNGNKKQKRLSISYLNLALKYYCNILAIAPDLLWQSISKEIHVVSQSCRKNQKHSKLFNRFALKSFIIVSISKDDLSYTNKYFNN